MTYQIAQLTKRGKTLHNATASMPVPTPLVEETVTDIQDKSKPFLEQPTGSLPPLVEEIEQQSSGREVGSRNQEKEALPVLAQILTYPSAEKHPPK